MAEHLHLVLAQVITAQETGHERRQDNTLAVHNPISSTRGEGRKIASRNG
jgi:hypothetical protein